MFSEMTQKKELCILHIGMPKTGSTTIQENFSLGVDDPRACYAPLNVSNHGWALCPCFMDEPEHYYYVSCQGSDFNIELENNKNLNVLVDAFRNPIHSIVIISGEDFFHLPFWGVKNNAVENLRLFLERFFKRVLVVAYARNPHSFMNSAFQELVKCGSSKTFDPSWVYPGYSRFKKFIDVFGSDNFLLWDFKPSEFINGDIVLDFCLKLGLQPQVSKIRVANESMSLPAVAVLFTYNFYKSQLTDLGTKFWELQPRLFDCIRLLKGQKFQLSMNYVRKAINDNLQDYLWISDLMSWQMPEDRTDPECSYIDNESQLMDISCRYIPDLLKLAGTYADDLVLHGDPLTVAKLIDRILIKIANDI